MVARWERQGEAETILLVEDEEGVRLLAHHFLEGTGYAVLAADGADQALRLAERHPGRIDLLAADVLMPRVSGPELADRLTALRPETKVLFLSGYPHEAVVGSGILAADVHFLEKPFTPDTLVRKVREVLGHGGAAPGSAA